MRSRLFLFAAFVSAALPAPAFDSAAWEKARRTYAVDAARLQREYSNHCSRVTMPAEDLKLPVELYPDGTVRTQLQAKRAQMFAGTGFVWGERVALEQFRADGSMETRIEAEGCLADRDSRSCWIEGEVRAVRGLTSLNGRDAYFSTSNGYLRIVHDAKIVSGDFALREIKL